MKNLKHKEKIKDSENEKVVKEEKKARDRVSKNYAEYFGRGSEKYIKKFDKWKQEKNEKKTLYEKGKITKTQYIEWLQLQKG